MLVGVLKEIKIHEYRVGLTPDSVRELIAHGHSVWVETHAGAGIGRSDDAYPAKRCLPICIWLPIRIRPVISSRAVRSASLMKQ